MAKPASAGTILIAANQAWNLFNFRRALIVALRERGFEVAAVAPEDPVYRRRLEALGCTFHAVKIDAKGLSPFRDARLIASYRRLMRRLSPVAYLSWTIKPNLYGALAARSLGIPAFPNVSGLGTAFIREDLLTRLVSYLYRIGFARVPAVFLQNEADRDEFVARGLVSPAQARLLAGSGIDIRHFVPQSRERHRGHFLLIARLLGDKGVREYVAAARMLRSDHPEWRFGILGFADVENRTAIPRAEYESWVADGIVELLPPVEDVRSAIERADCVVLPSYREGTSRVLLEGAAMARPLVASDVPGCREVVEDGTNGFLCAVKDAASLAVAMRRVATLPDAEWFAMGDAGRLKVQRQFSESAVIDAYLAALESASVVPLD